MMPSAISKEGHCRHHIVTIFILMHSMAALVSDQLLLQMSLCCMYIYLKHIGNYLKHIGNYIKIWREVLSKMEKAFLALNL